ncbi:hypothetical protein CP97_14670 [Aurantiacibacter atlanticus]|uniref:Uncharacterized protein n=1 Tax=Aurantiacibacter atlanticus TaxID=1648404 RepID=A0A168M0K1_9SPHN|nr:hypothetical protein CP97_14670 [Aurantiacibacter atlanticus]
MRVSEQFDRDIPRDGIEPLEVAEADHLVFPSAPAGETFTL